MRKDKVKINENYIIYKNYIIRITLNCSGHIRYELSYQNNHIRNFDRLSLENVFNFIDKYKKEANQEYNDWRKKLCSK
jgi:hypothetical protein